MAKRKKLWFILIPLIVIIGGVAVFASTTEVGRSGVKNLLARVLGGDSGGGGNQASRGGPGGRGGRGGFGGGGFGAALPVRVEAVRRESISQFILSNTTIDPEKQVDVLAQATGLAQEVLVEEGDRVSAGDVLVRLDRREVTLEVESARLRVENAQKASNLSEQMLKNSIVSQEDFDAKKYQLDTARVGLEVARIKLENTEIKSPIDGVVIDRNINEGDSVRSSQNVFSIGDFQPLFARIHVPEREIGKIKTGQEALISVESAPERQFKGIVKRISPVVDSQSGTVKVTIQIDRSEGILRPGMFSSVFIATETHPNALVVPKKALLLERDEEIVFAMDGESARRIAVKTGFSDSDRVEVVSGLNEGDMIITVGQDGLRDGAGVRLVGEVAARTGEPASQEGGRPSERQGGGGERPQARGGQQTQQPSSEGRGQAGGGGRGGGGFGRGGGGGFDFSQIPPERRKFIEERLLGNPEVKKEYDKRLKDDPELAKDPDKRAKFFGEMMAQFGGFGGGGGRR